MRLLLKVIIAIACINTIIGVCNVFVVPEEYKMYGNIVVYCIFSVQLILCSIILHSPDKDSK